MNRFQVKNVSPQAHLAGIWVAILITLATTLLSLVIVLNVLGNENKSLHSVICFSESFIANDKKLTPAQKTVDLRIYNRMLEVGHLPPCEVPK